MAFRGRANWVEELGWFDAAWFKGDTIVGVADTMLSVPHLRAWRCLDCGMVLLDVGSGVIYSPLPGEPAKPR